MGENVILWGRSYQEQEICALRPCSYSSVGDGTCQKFPPREKNCLQLPTKLCSEWGDRNGYGFAPCWNSPEPSAEQSKGLSLTVAQQLPLVTVFEAGSDKRVLSLGKGLQDCNTVWKYVVFLLYLVELAEGWGTFLFLFVDYLAVSLEKRNDCLCWGSLLVKMHLCWISFNSLEIRVDTSEALGFWEAGTC